MRTKFARYYVIACGYPLNYQLVDATFIDLILHNILKSEDVFFIIKKTNTVMLYIGVYKGPVLPYMDLLYNFVCEQAASRALKSWYYI